MPAPYGPGQHELSYCCDQNNTEFISPYYLHASYQYSDWELSNTMDCSTSSMSSVTLGRDIDSVNTVYEAGRALSNVDPNNIGFTTPTTLSEPMRYDSSQLRPSPPPRDDLKPHECKLCSSRFKHKKDLKRHSKTVHKEEDEPVFRCQCGKEEVRKDNYRRHLDSCSKGSHYPAYSCKCSFSCLGKEEHISHVKDCQYGLGRTGRPRPN